MTTLPESIALSSVLSLDFSLEAGNFAASSRQLPSVGLVPSVIGFGSSLDSRGFGRKICAMDVDDACKAAEPWALPRLSLVSV